MARTPKEIRELTQRLEALAPRDQARVLDQVLTPAMRMRLLVEQVRRRGNGRDEYKIDRVVNRAVQRARRAASSR